MRRGVEGDQPGEPSTPPEQTAPESSNGKKSE
jgi:hypothetical protein